jgi:uncharacterized protein (TIGR02145 family)
MKSIWLRNILVILLILLQLRVFSQETGTLTDTRDSAIYKWVKIGTQVWMAENLKYLPSVVGPDSSSQTTECYYVMGYKGTNVTDAKATVYYSTYGVLYNWPATIAGESSSNSNPSGVQGVCPSGWHLPNDVEWIQLIDYLGGELLAGGKLKESGTTHWSSPNEGATNESGFTALPGGIFIGGYWYGEEERGDWYSSTAYKSDMDYTFGLSYKTSKIYRGRNSKSMGFFVRCIKTNK